MSSHYELWAEVGSERVRIILGPKDDKLALLWPADADSRDKLSKSGLIERQGELDYATPALIGFVRRGMLRTTTQP